MKRPIPSDLREIREKLGGVRKIAKHYKASTRTVTQWMRASGIPTEAPSRKKTPPPDFAKLREKMNRKELKAYCGASERMLTQWTKELNLPRKSPPKIFRDIPEDFTPIAPTMTMYQLENYYRAGGSTVRRWLKETGCSTRKLIRYKRHKIATIPPQKDDNEHHRAANYLRKFMAVSPCGEDGKYKQDGSHYRVGQNVLSHEATIEKARAHQERVMRRIYRRG